MTITHTGPHRLLVAQRAWLRSCILLLLALPFALAWLPARADAVVGNGKAASESRSTGEFAGIGLAGGMALKLKQGSPASVIVHGDANLLPLIETAVEGDKVLQLRWKRGISVRTEVATWVEVVAPQIRSVASAGSGDIDIDTMKVPRLALSIKGSGDVHAKGLQNDEVQISIAGSGDFKLAGQATRLTIDLSGSGDIEAGDLRADEVTVAIAGSGNADVHAARKLVASVAGSGDVRYSGDPAVSSTIAGSGRVRKR
jgi:hypothetical protein